jgi:TolA-binding protein
MTELSNEEKSAIVNQHIRNARLNEYNAQVALLIEDTKEQKNQVNIEQLQKQIASEQSKIEILQKEIDRLLGINN